MMDLNRYEMILHKCEMALNKCETFDPLTQIKDILDARQKRAAEDNERRESNRRLKLELDRNYEQFSRELDKTFSEINCQLDTLLAECKAENQDAPPDMDLSFRLHPRRDLSAHVDTVAFGGYDAVCERFASEPPGTGTGTGAAAAKDDASFLRTAFEMVAYDSRCPERAARFLLDAAGRPGVPWTPQLKDFYASLTRLGGIPDDGACDMDDDGAGRCELLDWDDNLVAWVRLFSALISNETCSDDADIKQRCKGILVALIRMQLDTQLRARMGHDLPRAIGGIVGICQAGGIWSHVGESAAEYLISTLPHRLAHAVSSPTTFDVRLDGWRMFQQHLRMLLISSLCQETASASCMAAAQAPNYRVDWTAELQEVRRLVGESGRSLGQKMITSQYGSDSAAEWRLDSLMRCVDDVLTCALESNRDGGHDLAGEWMSSLVRDLENDTKQRRVAKGTGPFLTIFHRPWHLISLLASLGVKYAPFEDDGSLMSS